VVVLGVVADLDDVGEDVQGEVVFDELVEEDRLDFFRLDFLHYLVVVHQLLDQCAVVVES
jgi:hypothetical protein